MLERELPFSRIAAFGLVSLPMGTIGLPIAIYLAPLYGGQLGLSLGVIGLALILTRLLDLITDPLVGIISDRWRPRIGRRKVWLVIGTVLMMTGVYLLFRPAPGVDIVYFVASVSLVYVGYTTLGLPYKAWAAELSSDYHVRTRISSTMQFFNIVGLIVSTLIPAWILAQEGSTSVDVMEGVSLFVLIALPIAAVIVFLFVPEPEAPARKAAFNFRAALKLLVSNGPFARITIVVLIATIGEVFRQTITVFFARDIVGVVNIGAVYFYYFIAGLIAVPGWMWLANRIEKHRAMTLALIIIAITNAAMYFLSMGQVGAFIALFVAKGVCFGAVIMLPHAMVADAVDIDTAKSLDRQQGLFFAVEAMVQKLGFALGAGLPLMILGAIGYNSEGETNAAPLEALSLLYSVLPAVLVLIAAWLTWNYSLTAARHQEIREEIAARLSAVDGAG